MKIESICDLCTRSYDKNSRKCYGCESLFSEIGGNFELSPHVKINETGLKEMKVLKSSDLENVANDLKWGTGKIVKICRTNFRLERDLEWWDFIEKHLSKTLLKQIKEEAKTDLKPLKAE